LVLQADVILLEELHKAGIYREVSGARCRFLRGLKWNQDWNCFALMNWFLQIAQAFCVLTNCKSVGVMGDGRTYEYLCGIRLVSSTDYMTADW